MKKHRTGHRIKALLAAALFFGCYALSAAYPMRPVDAAKQKDLLLSLSTAKRLAIANSDKVENLEVQIMAKEGSVASAIRSLREKERNMSTFRWSPLLSFKFPTKPDETEAFEFQFKPTQLKNQQKILQHKINDAQLEVSQKVSIAYIDIISATQELDYMELRIKKLEESLEKMKIKRREGSVTAKQVETIQTRYDTALRNKTKTETKLMRSKQKMSDYIGLDVTTGYRFQKSFVTANMTREDIPYLQNSALVDDHGIFEAKMEEEEANLALQLNYQLIRNKYGGYIGTISPYVELAMKGSKIPKKAFKQDYDRFLKEIDEPWQGSYRILFISFPKEWLKGSLDGIRYVEDDPQVLYTAALDYESARKSLEVAKKDLKNTVYEQYDNYVETKNAYEDAVKEYYSKRSQVTVDEVKNLLGQLSDEEYETEYSEFEEAQSDMNEAIRTYSDSLFEFDKITCGGVSTFFSGEQKGKGVSIIPIVQEGLSYRFKPIADKEEFLLYVNVPADFNAKSGLNVTHFQLRCNNKNIGEKTSVSKGMRHLSLSASNVTEAFIRIFDGDTVLDDCPIDPAVSAGPLSLTTGYTNPKKLRVIGTYRTDLKMGTDTVEISIEFDQAEVVKEYLSGENVDTYSITTESGQRLGTGDRTKASSPFKHLALIKDDIGNLLIHLYDSAGNEIGVAKFDTGTKQIYHDVDDVEAERIAREKAKRAEEAQKQAEVIAGEEADNTADEAAKALLARLGMDETPDNIAYARSHMNELTYAADLKDNSQALEKNSDSVKKQIQRAKSEGKDTKELEERLETLSKQKSSVDKTLGDMNGYQSFAGKNAKNEQEINRLKNTILAARRYLSEGKDTLTKQISAMQAKKTSLNTQIKNERSSLNEKLAEAESIDERKELQDQSKEKTDMLQAQLSAVDASIAAKRKELNNYNRTAANKQREISDSISGLKAMGVDTSAYE